MKITVAIIILCFGLLKFAWADAAVRANEQSQQAIKYYQITGVTGELAQNVQHYLGALVQRLEEETEGRPAVMALQQQGLIAVRSALQPFGYFQPEITVTSVQGQRIHYTIVPGPLFKIARVQLTISGEGKNEAKFQQAIAHFPLQAGQAVLAERYKQAKQLLFDVAFEQGYLQATLLKHEIQVNLMQHDAVIVLVFFTGPKLYFGSMIFNHTPFKESFLRRFAPFKPGETYASSQVLALQNGLSGSGYFQSVSVVPHTEAPQNYQVPIEVNLVPRKAQQYSFGLGYGTDTGVRGTLGWEWRRVTATGHRLSALLRASQVQSSLQTIYTIPGENPTTDQYSLNASLVADTLDQGTSHTLQIGAAHIKTINAWQRTLFLNDQVIRSQLEGQPATWTHFLLPGISLLRVKSDNPLYAKEGSRINLSVQGSHQNLLSKATLLQATAKGKFITSPTAKSRLILRGDLGYTVASDLSVLPLPLQFFAGGTQTIRGFSYQALGPGRYLLVGSIEWQHEIIDKWHVAVFFDTGNAMNSFATPLQRAAGLGVVWVSPVGPVELTFANAFTQPDKPWMLQFSMGPDLL